VNTNETYHIFELQKLEEESAPGGCGCGTGGSHKSGAATRVAGTGGSNKESWF